MFYSYSMLCTSVTSQIQTYIDDDLKQRLERFVTQRHLK